MEVTREMEKWVLVEHATQGNRSLAVTVEAKTEIMVKKKTEVSG